MIDTFSTQFGFSGITSTAFFPRPESAREISRVLRKFGRTRRMLYDKSPRNGADSFGGTGEPRSTDLSWTSLRRTPSAVSQVATIQLDLNLPERFDLSCINEKGEHERIVMIHSAIMGSIERFTPSYLNIWGACLAALAFARAGESSARIGKAHCICE